MLVVQPGGMFTRGALRVTKRGMTSASVRVVSAAACLGLVALFSFFDMPDAHCARLSDNLLRNAGFEDGTGEQPAEWRSFVVPAEGVEAVWDKNTRHAGERSVMLRVETPYTDEVYNNWYQHIPSVPTGEKLVVSGYVKSEDVTEAAIWLQCWRDGSREVLRFATTSIASPIAGSVDWTLVKTSIVPPQETAFLTVRCVITGKGTAWFDDLRLAAETESERVSPPEKEPVKANNTDTDPFRELLEAHKTLLQTNKSLAEYANVLSEEIAKLREEINELRRLVETWDREEENKGALERSRRERVPPFRPSTRKGAASPNLEPTP